MAKIPEYPALTTPNNNDLLIIEDSVSSSTKKITRGNFLGAVSHATTAIANPYKFRARRTSAFTPTDGVATKIPFNTEDFDTNNNFDVTTNVGRYTIPVSGFYQINGYLNCGSNPNGFLLVALYKNGASYQRGVQVDANAAAGSSYNDLIQLTAGDYIELFVFEPTGVATDVAAGIQPYFSGFLVSRT